MMLPYMIPSHLLGYSMGWVSPLLLPARDIKI